MFRTIRWFSILCLASIGNVEAADQDQVGAVAVGTGARAAVPGSDVDFDEDLETVRNRVIGKLLEPAVDQHQIAELMNSIRDDGRWPGIDYADTSRTGFEHQVHLNNMLALGRAYRRPGSPYHDDAEVKEAVWQALDFWIGHDFLSENWWWNQIGTPERIGDLLLIMDEATTDEQVEGSAPIVGRANLGAWGARPGGDLILIAGVMGKYALFRRDLDLLDEALTAIAGEIGFAVERGDPSDVRGLQTDFSFHHRHDRVTSTITYGLGFASDFVEWADMVAGTRFAFPDESVRLMVDFFLDGVSETMAFGTYPDPGARNRGITRRGALDPRSSELPAALLRVTSYRKAELEAIVRIRDGERTPDLTSSRFFWHSEYYSHQRPHYFASVRMYSSRNHSMEEPHNSEGLQNHHLADGYTFITRTGAEYLDIFPVWDWQKIPGTTVVQKPDLPDPEEIQQPGVSDFVGAVTDGRYGAVAFDFVSPLDPLSVRKSWYFFDDEFVALGAGIGSDSEFPVATTLNQSLLNGDVVAGQAGGAASVLRQGEHDLSELVRVHHDSTAYLFPEPTAVRVENTERSGAWQDINGQAWARASEEERREVFTLWLDHGVSPRRDGYAYIVVPGIEAADIDRHVESSPIEVLVNTPEVQAVAHEGLGIVQLIFYEPGEVEIGEGVSVAVETPGLVMVRMSGRTVEEITTADPTRQGRSIPVRLTRAATAEDFDTRRIQPWSEEPRYWQYRGEPILLLGGSDEDNLFNYPELPPDGLASHLDLLVSVGGNYVRNTMSSRDEGNLWPFARDGETGLYDLDRFNDAYWNRFQRFLDLTAERGIIVQVEVFDRFDYARDPWDANPFNPKNNLTYTSASSGLPETIETHPGRRENPFFRTTPRQEDNARVLAYQEALVERMLEISLEYDNVLYSVSNETNESEHWSAYWARFIRARAEEAGVGVEVTETWDAWDLSDPEHRHTFDHPAVYSFVDTSQNNHQVGQQHWDNMQWARTYVADPARPVNNVKIYGGIPHGGGLTEGTHKLWRNVLGGLASSRFHRPAAGAGLSGLAQAHLRSVTLFLEAFDVFAAEPANELLSDRDENEAYCAVQPGLDYAVYFTDGGTVALDVAAGRYRARWLNIAGSAWADGPVLEGGQAVHLAAPSEGQWAVVLTRIE